MLLFTQPTDPWVRYDFLLLSAYQILHDETCPRCGQPVWICRSSSRDVYFDAHSDVCQGERAVREAEDNRKPRGERAKASERKEWGRFMYPVPRTFNEAPLPTREDYLKELNNLRGNPV